MTAQTEVQPAIATRERRRLPGPIQLRAMELGLRGISKRYGALQWFLEVMPPGRTLPFAAFIASRCPVGDVALRAARSHEASAPAACDAEPCTWG